MITNTGRSILAKYLVGQSPAYASYIAIGCGPKAVASDYTFSEQELEDMANKTALDFEMFRVPIVSRGYVNEDGIAKIVFTGELPTEERYEITEVGVFSAGSNPSAGSNDSKTIYAFTQNENWEYHTDDSAVAIPVVYQPLDPSSDNIINAEQILGLDDVPVFQTNADNRTFTTQRRSDRYERSRFLNNIILMRGDTASISTNAQGHLELDSGYHIHLNGVNFDFNRNAPTDEIKLAFSLVNKDGEKDSPDYLVDNPTYTFPIDSVKILLEFGSQDLAGSGEFARFEVDLQHAVDHDFFENRYVVVTKQLQELYKSPGFSWSIVNIAKVSVCVADSAGNALPGYYVALDSVRFENVTDRNPLYGLTGYSVIKTPTEQPIIKRSNTTNYIEFRFAMDVG
jgi:hypothetical protein